MKSALTILFLVSCCLFGSWAGEIPVQLAQKAILGEAAGQSHKEKVGIACALRNRGNVHGVYGATRKPEWYAAQPKWAVNDCAKAWSESKSNDVVFGATHWDSTDFRTPWWAKKMVMTVQIGKTKFYKPKA